MARKTKRNKVFNPPAQTTTTETTKTQPKKPTSARSAARQRSNPWLWIGGALLIVAFLALGVYLTLNQSAGGDQPIATATVAAVPPPVGPADYCRGQPGFAQTLGFSPQALVSTSQTEPVGLAVIDIGPNGQPSRTYQDPTWDDAGWLGYVTFDGAGNLYVYPAPRESLTDNPPEKANIVYKVDGVTAQMTSLITLTAAAPNSPENPFGILGMTFDCDLNSLYVSTVAGSARASEVGKIVQVPLNAIGEAATFPDVDAFGLSVYNWPDGKRLYYGLARTPDIYSIGLDENGNFVGEPQYELSMLDPNFRAWRIRFEQNGTMTVRGLEFDFNLIATSERREVAYQFRRNTESGGWEEVSAQ